MVRGATGLHPVRDMDFRQPILHTPLSQMVATTHRTTAARSLLRFPITALIRTWNR